MAHLSQRRRLATFAVIGVLAFAISGCGGSGPSAPGQPTTVATTGDDTPEPEVTDAPDTSAPQVTADIPDVGTDRPSSVSLSISGADFGDADGSYSASGMTRLCGDFGFATSGNLRAFDYGFPHDIPPPAKPQIGDVTFNAVDLLPGATATSFYLSINVVSAGGQEPPSVVIQPGTAAGDSGTAQRTEANGTTTLTVNARNDFGETVSLTATCGPRPG